LLNNNIVLASKHGDIIVLNNPGAYRASQIESIACYNLRSAGFVTATIFAGLFAGRIDVVKGQSLFEKG